MIFDFHCELVNSNIPSSILYYTIRFHSYLSFWVADSLDRFGLCLRELSSCIFHLSSLSSVNCKSSLWLDHFAWRRWKSERRVNRHWHHPSFEICDCLEGEVFRLRKIPRKVSGTINIGFVCQGFGPI